MLPAATRSLVAAIGGTVHVTAVLLAADATTIAARLGLRERGSALAAHLTRSAEMAKRLDDETPPDTVRIATDRLAIADTARTVFNLLEWRR